MYIPIKYLYITAFCMMISCLAAAQNTDTIYYRAQSVRSAGVGFPALNYSLLSQLKHSGYSFNFHSTRFREKPKYFSQLRLHFDLGLLYNNANDSYITTLGFHGGWSRHRHVSDRTRPLRLLLGAGLDSGVAIYLKEDNTNNPLAYFFNLSVSPNLLFKYRFNIRQTRFEIAQQIDVPFVSLVSSSDYSSGLAIGIIEKDANFFDAMRLTSFGSLKKCVTITTLDVTPSAQRRQKMPVFRVTYIFSGMNYRNGDFTIKSTDNMLLFGLIFHLFR